ncbi:hypothetical protein [Actinotalea sp. C106]|uniref:hypothetical protein n=1 Tax=Actinotalea sp. C106 TaxID=2908644 RepID=UPI00202849F0|nr:hypothetical protein [Actinotalea sp. C106]
MIPAPLFVDPVHGGGTDPVLVRRGDEWWMVYTQRRARVEEPGVAWVHGSDLGVAVSTDRGRTWEYRGVVEGLDLEPGRRDTFWAPEIVHERGTFHMFVSHIEGVPEQWAGHERVIRHYTSLDLEAWTYRGEVPLSSRYVIDACLHPLPDGGYRLWYKDEADESHTWAADSADLDRWTVVGPVLTHRPHEGPNVFELGGRYWMLVDEWRGQGVFWSADLTSWTRQGLILDQPGTRPEDATIGLHADVVVVDPETAYVIYFTHPGASGDGTGAAPDRSYDQRRSVIQAARLRVLDGVLTCDRDEDTTIDLG